MCLTMLPGLEVASCSVKDLLHAGNMAIGQTNIFGKLTIPEYQRPYVWGEKQVLRLLNDLNGHSGKADYYLGSLILHRTNGKLNIIDGQQRITTLFILQQFQQDALAAGIVYKSPVSMAGIQSNIKMLRGKLASGKITINNIALDRINVTLVVTDSEDLAYTFFETQNTGGKRLSGADIIKSHHLRAIRPTAQMNSKAMRWESTDMAVIGHVISLLAKARFWDALERREFPSYRDTLAVKESVVGEFTENTLHDGPDRSYLTVEVVKGQHGEQMGYMSGLPAIRQPLSDGNNFMDYLDGYAGLYEQLFITQSDYRVDPRFYLFRAAVINGENGTAFLKDLFELAVIVFVSRFGLKELFGFSLWCFRYIYSLRVVKERTVREDGVYAFARDMKLLDRILNAFSAEGLIEKLRDKDYTISMANCGANNVKGKYILMLGNYFSGQFSTESIDTTDFDNKLKKAIQWQMKKGS